MTSLLEHALAHLRAGRWETAHEIAQGDESRLGCWLHGVVHAVEGDLGNARYWYGRAGEPFREPWDLARELEALERAVHGNSPS